jgi:hypothetical protein
MGFGNPRLPTRVCAAAAKGTPYDLMKTRILFSCTLLALGLAAGASAQNPPTGNASVGGRNLGAITLPAYSGTILMDSLGTPTELEAPGQQVFAAVIAAYSDLKIPIQIRDSLGGLVGNLRLIERGTFARDRMSRWFECGSGLSGPYADTYRINIAIVTFIDVLTPKRTRIRTAIAASGKNIEGTSSEAVRCASSGDLEARITSLITGHLTTP